MKICFLSLQAYPLFNSKCKATFGGSEVQVSNYAKELAKKTNYDVSIMVADFGQKKQEVIEGVRLVKTYSLRKKLSNYILAPFKLYNSLREENPDLVITRAKGPEVGIASKYCRRNEKKHIHMIAHDGEVQGKFFKGLFGKMFKRGFLRADHIISQNDYQQREYKRKFGKDNSSQLNASYETKSSKVKKDGSVLWVGRSDSWKRPELFLELAKKHRDKRFVMVLPKSSDDRTWERIVKQSENVDNLALIEGVPFKEIQKLFDKAAVFVNTSESEGFPNTFVQAGIAKTPILSLAADPNKMLSKSKCGYLCKGIDDLSKKLDKLLGSKKDWEEKSKNVNEYVKKNHDIKKNIRQLESIINNVLHKS